MSHPRSPPSECVEPDVWVQRVRVRSGAGAAQRSEAASTTQSLQHACKRPRPGSGGSGEDICFQLLHVEVFSCGACLHALLHTLLQTSVLHALPHNLLHTSVTCIPTCTHSTHQCYRETCVQRYRCTCMQTSVDSQQPRGRSGGGGEGGGEGSVGERSQRATRRTKLIMRGWRSGAGRG